jgi:hypothetical protein
MSTDSLHTLVTAAIWRAEQIEEHGIGSAPLAWAEVSAFEEDLAAAIPVAQPEGRIARRGAVRAALKARNYARAQALAQRYLAEPGAPESLSEAIREILAEDARALADRFRYAARHHAVADARDLAGRLLQRGPFGLAP